MGAYFAYPLLLLFTLVFSPISIANAIHFPSTILLVITFVSGLFLLYITSQFRIHPNWERRILYFPIFTLLITGMVVNNSIAIFAGLLHKKIPFMRTPKINTGNIGSIPQSYSPQMDWIILVELIIVIISIVWITDAIHRLPEVIPILSFLALSVGYVCLVSIAEKWTGVLNKTVALLVQRKSL